ncbi:serine hydrolase domain-containing protein [Thermomonospora cellulosilytica]|uniref:CubicO group peptidase (Beta-lactamase class C family) n=1 Tax=Thermomonospora cellulosilytica TaxID=1411118 RepID=A0A7W3R7J8_9ACTN|nr:serine hydrolase domain-containing protein [Thermomonospora cellulosilytica]MBA9002594.1 CubicO group peptidase (beta-lactamase class C family) [Thermomonospora cellulosilytica]
MRERVQAVIDGLVESGAERGMQVAVYRGGELVVDAVAGVADPRSGRKIAPDTPIYCYSVGKTMTSAIVLMLIERGAFGHDTPVAELWPEFGAHGKGGVTVRHVLTHTAGVPAMPADATPDALGDWDGICAAIADSTLWWEPGTRLGYHAYTFGYILGEVVRRVTGKPISQVLREEVAGPLGIADEMYFGMPEPELGRVAVLEEPEEATKGFEQIPEDAPMFSTAPKAIFPTAAFGNLPQVLRADIPAGGKMTARAVARLYAALLGNVDGVRLISPERLTEITAVAVEGTDQIMGNEAAFGLGFPLGHPVTGEQTVFGWAGVGGTYAWADTATGLTAAVTKNRLSMDFSTVEAVTKAING